CLVYTAVCFLLSYWSPKEKSSLSFHNLLKHIGVILDLCNSILICSFDANLFTTSVKDLCNLLDPIVYCLLQRLSVLLTSFSCFMLETKHSGNLMEQSTSFANNIMQ
ncbi:hypothetical protein ACJX0J_023336, partial [Zea mays]